MVYTGKRKYIKKSFIFVLFILLVLQMSAVIKIEILTAKYYDIFQDAYKSNTMLGEMDSFKVLEYDGATAKVYYISKNKTSGDVLSFANVVGAWEETYWETIWSKSGSASDVIWPYWWHFIYAGL